MHGFHAYISTWRCSTFVCYICRCLLFHCFQWLYAHAVSRIIKKKRTHALLMSPRNSDYPAGGYCGTSLVCAIYAYGNITLRICLFANTLQDSVACLVTCGCGHVRLHFPNGSHLPIKRIILRSLAGARDWQLCACLRTLQVVTIQQLQALFLFLHIF